MQLHPCFCSPLVKLFELLFFLQLWNCGSAPAAYLGVRTVANFFLHRMKTNIRHRLELELSNRSSPPTWNTADEQSPPPPYSWVNSSTPVHDESDRAHFISPSLKSPGHPPVRSYPRAQSHLLDFLLSEQSILSTEVSLVCRNFKKMSRTFDIIFDIFCTHWLEQRLGRWAD